MARLTFAIIIFTALRAVPASAAQQVRADYGPVVSAYLTSLAEELNELNFQLRHHEISRADYTRAYQRILIRRRFVERRAAENREDLVPEIQALTAGELGTLGLNPAPETSTLHIGMQLDERWKLIGIEQRGARFFVFERITERELKADGLLPAQGTQRPLPNLRDVIETVVVDEGTTDRPANPPPEHAVRERVVKELAPAQKEGHSASPMVQVTGPRMLNFYLPVYTPAARARQIEGEVIVTALFRWDGKIKEVAVERGLGYGLNQRAVEAVKRTTFEPARLNGKPVDVRAQLVFTFKLDRVTVRVRPKTREAEAKGSQQ